MPSNTVTRRRPRAVVQQSLSQEIPKSALSGLLERHAVAIAVVLVAVATMRIGGTWWVYSHTSDEPAHISCGMQLLDRGIYEYEAQHPPLARVCTAIGPYMLGARSHGSTGPAAMNTDGMHILYTNHNYDQMLAAARAGVLPFFWLACLVVYVWARRDFGPRTALIALLLFTSLPPVLGHAGLATTDMALTACFGAAFVAARRWVETPTVTNAALLGVAGALAVLSKFSSLVLFPAVAIAVLLWYFAWARPPLGAIASALRARIPSLGAAGLICVLIVWAGYRFSFGKVFFADLSLPAPELFAGIRQVFTHNATGHRSYLLGRLSQSGFWHFYPIAIAVKTPVAYLAFLGAGLWIAFRNWRQQFALAIPVAFAAGVLAIGIVSRINIGIRHILPIYLAFSILSAIGIEKIIKASTRRKWANAATVLLIGWLLLSSGRAHPDYLPYFIEFAADHPERILADSDLDWGQDMKRLQRRLAQGGAKVLTYTQLISGFLQEEQGFPLIRPINPRTPLAGWNAVGITDWKLSRLGRKNPNEPIWPDVIAPHEIIGKSIYLWYFPPSSGLPLVDPDKP